VALGGKTTVVISDILQSGMSDEELYTRVAQLVAHAEVDTIICIGERIKEHLDKFSCKRRYYASTEEFMRALSTEDIAGRTILLKGNRRSHFERVCHSLERRSHTTVLEVNLDAMTHNVGYFRRHLPMNHRLVAMVKAHSYGAGDVEVAQLMQRLGVSYLAVAFADEGITLREKGITMPIVVLNADAGSFDKMVAYSLEPEIYSLHSLCDFIASAERYGVSSYPIHIKLDTGMHRLGFVESELEDLLSALEQSRSVKVASVFAHLSCADDESQDDFTREQIALFDKMSSRIASALPYDIIRHTANSAAIERFPEARFDMCRLGLGLYGYGYCHNDELQPVAALKTRIVQLRQRKAGECIGYGRAGRLMRDSVIATIPIGYADGLDRHLGEGRWSMLVAGKPAPTVGRICMDSCMIDVTDIEGVQEGDQVVIFSSQSGNTTEDMARVLGTIPYEILTSVPSRVKRIYVKE
jgi:alanine racemase